MNFAIIFLAMSVVFIAIGTNVKFKTMTVKQALDIAEVKRNEATLAAGLIDLRQKNDYVESVVNGSLEK